MEQNNDDLRNRFTAWLELVVKHARIDYIRKLNRKPTVICLEEVSENFNSEYYENLNIYNTSDFQNQRLQNAIGSLSKIQQEVIKMLFFDALKPNEVAKKLGRPEQYIYNIRYRILKKLKELVGDKYDG